jgi:hypothetical protein
MDANVVQGAGGGPSEDNVTGLLVRSVSAGWTQGCLLAVDAGSHLASITNLLSNHFPMVSQSVGQQSTPQKPDPASASTAAYETELVAPEASDLDQVLALASPKLKVLEDGPFSGIALPHASARANGVHVVREYVSTYLITHPHLDHFSAFAVNTAAFHNTNRPKRVAALPFTVNAIKQHIFNDVIWPNLTDEDNGVGLVTFQRLTEGGNLALGD